MALECFWWGPSLDLLRDSRNGTLWLEHCLGCFLSDLNSFIVMSNPFWNANFLPNMPSKKKPCKEI